MGSPIEIATMGMVLVACCAACAAGVPIHRDDVHGNLNELIGGGEQSIGNSVGAAIFERDILAFHIVQFT